MSFYDNREPRKLAALYQSDPLCHFSRDFWKAYINSSPGHAGKILATYFLRELDKDHPVEEDESSKFVMHIAPEYEGNISRIIEMIKDKFPELGWENQNDLGSSLYGVRGKQSGRTSLQCIVSDDIDPSSSTARMIRNFIEGMGWLA